ncbi:ATP synthase subunit C lysine N-methyltransferase-like isoform X2 [Montipora foliosa]|uniref:ATP synthase subunit C lysine N-methyltransferase-like isoform X2 n=1 Tax=Montipora foliosa TaxID=591990 RepID=UPI0035F1EBB2
MVALLEVFVHGWSHWFFFFQVFAAARHGYQAHGYELNHWLVWYSKLQARLQGVHKNATFSRANLWKVKLSNLDIVVIFGVAEMMSKLKEKLHAELKDDAQVLACCFPLPNWMPVKGIEEGMDSVWLYWKTSDATKKEN